MARSPLMNLVQRIARTARVRACEADGESAVPSSSRRTFVRRTLALASAAALPLGAWPAPVRGAGAHRVVIVGAGLGGLCAAYELRKTGIVAELFEASPRAGGRCWSERRVFDGQIAERGGELIDTAHEEIRALAGELGLALDDLLAAEAKGSEALFVLADGPYSLDAATSDFERMLPALDADAKTLGEDLPTYKRATAAQRALDRMSAARQRLHRGARWRSLRDQRRVRDRAAARIAARPLFAVRRIRPALSRARRQRPDRATARVAARRAHRNVRATGRDRAPRRRAMPAHVRARPVHPRRDRRSRDTRASVHVAATGRPRARRIPAAQAEGDSRARHGPQHEAAAAIQRASVGAAQRERRDARRGRVPDELGSHARTSRTGGHPELLFGWQHGDARGRRRDRRAG